MIEYLVDGRKFSFSYPELRESYLLHCQMSDEEFLKNLPSAIHLACVICYFKGIPSYVCLSDTGIIHELAHLLHIPEGNTTHLRDIRQLFVDMLKLA